MLEKNRKTYQTGIVKKSIIVNASKKVVWREISKIAGLAAWVVDVKQTTYLSKKKRGVGAIREITFAKGNTIEEHVTQWNHIESFTYVATKGLPLRAYVATISITQKAKNKTQITWKSYINSKKMTKKQFLEFTRDMELFYRISLKNLKSLLEK